MRYEPDLFFSPFGSLGGAVKSRMANVALAVSFLAALVGLTISARDATRASNDLRSAYRAEPDRATKAEALIVAHNGSPRSVAISAPDFVSDLPTSALDDQQIRFATKLASGQSIVVQQLQAEPLKTEPGHLGQHRLTMQLRGDYRDLKGLCVALLSKFPGLTLERLTVRHHAGVSSTMLPVAGSSLPPADRSDDEATIEMIQYLQPAKAP